MARRVDMRFLARKRPGAVAFLFWVALLDLSPQPLGAQNLGSTPQINKAVQGQTAAQPEGAFLNLVNWIGNVIPPVGAAICLPMAGTRQRQGPGAAPR